MPVKTQVQKQPLPCAEPAAVRQIPALPTARPPFCPAPDSPLCPSSAAESDRGFKKKHVTHLPVIEALLIQEMFFFSFLLFFPFVLAITLAQ